MTTTTTTPDDAQPPAHELVQCTNCGKHGWHTTDMCPDTSALPVDPPAGAASAGEWGEGWRCIYGQRHEIGAYVAGAWACQEHDGTIRRNAADVYVDEMDEHGCQCERLNLSAAEARQLGAALIAAADEADRMTSHATSDI